MIDVDRVYLEAIQDILKHYAPDCEVRAFGSRYKWTAKSYSDLDLALIGKQKYTIKEMAALREAFEESALPFRVDILDWHSISLEFQKVIEQGYEVIQKMGGEKISSEWKRAKLKDCARFQEGYVNPSQTIPEYFGNEIKWLRANDLNNSYVYETSRRLSKKGFESAGKSALLFKPNSLAISKSGTIGRLGILKDYMCGNRAVINIEVDNTVCDNLFIFYSLLFRQKLIEDMGTGSVQRNLYVPVLAELEIDLPSLSTQRRIADILSALDEKIELNRQTNATLEAIAQAIFKEWFVDFNFPGATGEMVESALGLIPRGWEVKPLPEAIKVNPSRSLRKGVIAPYLDMANMPTLGHRGLEWVDRSFGSGTKFINGDTLLARITPCLENGKTAFVDFLPEGQTGWGSTEYIVLHPKPPLPSEYGYYLARFDDLRNHAIQNMIGTSGRQRTPASSLDSFLMVVPPEPIARTFGEIAQSNMAQIRALDEESRTLTALRDAILPKLMNGEIELKMDYTNDRLS